jgi:hypothetical protein
MHEDIEAHLIQNGSYSYIHFLFLILLSRLSRKLAICMRITRTSSIIDQIVSN